MNNEVSNLLFRLPKDVHKEFKLYCTVKGVSMQKCFEAVVISLLNQSKMQSKLNEVKNKKGK